MALKVIAEDPFLTSPRLRVGARQTPAIEVRMRVTGGEAANAGVLYFTTEDSPNWNGDKRVVFDVTADGEWHVYRVVMADHPKWRGEVISGLRLDPVGGGAETQIEIDYVRGAP